jgi:hypothetical protein
MMTFSRIRKILYSIKLQRLATGWTAEGSEFEVPVEAIIFHIVQTGSEAHTASYPMGTGGSFPEVKAAGA